MSRPRVLILTGLGLNCEAETAAAFAMAGAQPDQVHLLDLLDGTAKRKLADYPLLAFIGGFAFGDHLGAGSVFANKIRWRLYDDLLAFIAKGGLALGVCNGFQTMVRLGLLPGLDGDFKTPRATLAPNDRPGYRDAWVTLGFDPASPCLWTRGIDTMELPSRHGEGKFLADTAVSAAPRARAPRRRALRRPRRPPHGGMALQSQRLTVCCRRRVRPVGTTVRIDAAPRRLPLSVPPPAVDQAQARGARDRRGRWHEDLPERREGGDERELTPRPRDAPGTATMSCGGSRREGHFDWKFRRARRRSAEYAVSGNHTVGPALTIADARGQRIGRLTPLSAEMLNDVELMERLSRWRNRARESFLTQFHANAPRTSQWLRNVVLTDPKRALFLVFTETGKLVGHVGVKDLTGGGGGSNSTTLSAASSAVILASCSSRSSRCSGGPSAPLMLAGPRRPSWRTTRSRWGSTRR